MKDSNVPTTYSAQRRQFSPAWESPLWEDFPDVDMEDEDPPIDADLDDFSRGSK